ncbi:MAG: GNAT family N-acetyltransferase [Nocardioides sp.]|nr:GNAT family N-acetyltransferase [Nocardioides sp.]
MDIRPIDIHDDDLMREFHRVVDAGYQVGREDAPRFTYDEYVGSVRAPDSGERAVHVGAVDGDRLVGAGVLYEFLLDNTEKAWLEVIVDPDHRERGAGNALLEHLLALAESDGRTVFLTDTNIPFTELETHRYRRFLERRGFSQSNIEVVRHLTLPVDDDAIRKWMDHAAEKSDGYRVETFVGHFPDELAESLCVLLGQLSVDAPTGTVDFEEEVMTPQRLAERYAMSAAQGRETFETVALTPEGQVAAQTTLLAQNNGTDAFQWGTFVHREHRGHRLGLAVKAANLRALQEQRPQITRVRTQNGETNGYMIDINEQIGFRPVEVSAEFVKRA